MRKVQKTKSVVGLGFGITVFREDPSQLNDCLSRVRTVYPLEEVFVISDGNDLSGYAEACGLHDADYFPGERLKLASNGAAWWHRFFEIALGYRADLLFKMDADTRLHRAFRSFPPLDVFGTVERDYDIQGGLQGFQRSAAERIFSSGFCLDPLYRDPTRWGPANTIRYTSHTGQISSDHTLAHIIRRLSLTWGDWAEVDCQWHKRREFRDGIAASHPHKNEAH